jgi:4-amino-4-deoxy-L-arabinose transferase-like glycosyltransferase
MNKKLSIILLLLILTVGTFLRFYKLGSIPISPDWDEVALGYDAHSLATTGRDEFGNFLPAILRSYDDYKPAVYAYLAIPSVEAFGLNTFSVRLPSAIIGIIGILATYFLVKEVFNYRNEENKKKKNIVEILALLSAFLLAISPWHLQFSRIAFETNVGLTFNILVALFFIMGLRKNWLLIVSLFIAGVNLSVYQSERVFTPLLVMSLIVIFRKELIKINKKILVASLIAGLLAVAPAINFLNSDHNALLRVKATSIFNNQTEVLNKDVVRLDTDRKTHDVVGFILDNRRVIYAKNIAGAYISHFDPKWLFLTGDINRHHAPAMGLMYLVFLPFVLYGIYKLLFGPFDKKTKYIIISWFLLAPVPAAITTGVPHAVRTLNSLLPYCVIIAIGIFSFVDLVAKIHFRVFNIYSKYIIFSFCLLLFLLNFVYFLNQYFVQQNYAYAYDWQYGYEQAVPQAEQLKKNYAKVIVSDTEPLNKSYMFFLFYLNFPPAEYQKIGTTSSGSFSSMHHFDKYEFRNFTWDEIKQNKAVLFIGGAHDFPNNIVAKKIIPFPNGKPAILLVDPKDNHL